MRNQITILFIWISCFLNAQQELDSKLLLSFGYRSMPIPECNCFFKPTMFDVKSRSNVYFTGVSFQHKTGFSIGLEGGIFKRKFVETGVSDSQQWNVYYYQNETAYKGTYVNTWIGYTIGKRRISLTSLVGLDYHMERASQTVYYWSHFTNIQYATQEYPTVQPTETQTGIVQGQTHLKSFASLLGLRLNIDITDYLLLYVGSELQFWPYQAYSNSLYTKRSHGSYRLALTYKFGI